MKVGQGMQVVRRGIMNNVFSFPFTLLAILAQLFYKIIIAFQSEASATRYHDVDSYYNSLCIIDGPHQLLLLQLTHDTVSSVRLQIQG